MTAADDELYGPFIHDGALDWDMELLVHDDLRAMRTVLSSYTDEEWAYSWAAAELVALLGNRPRPWFPHEIVEWARRIDDTITPSDVEDAYRATEELLLSDTRSLWADPELFVASIQDLRSRLRQLSVELGIDLDPERNG